MVQEVFGVNGHVRSVADRVAAAGYVAVAPALFDRVERGVELSYDPDGTKRGIALAHAIPQDQHLASVEAAIAPRWRHTARSGSSASAWVARSPSRRRRATASSRRRSATTAAASRRWSARTPPEPLCPVELHFGEHDDHIPAADIAKVKAAYPAVPVHTYDAGHGFNCDVRASYDKASADAAWTRTLAFFAREMRA